MPYSIIPASVNILYIPLITLIKNLKLWMSWKLLYTQGGFDPEPSPRLKFDKYSILALVQIFKTIISILQDPIL